MLSTFCINVQRLIHDSCSSLENTIILIHQKKGGLEYDEREKLNSFFLSLVRLSLPHRIGSENINSYEIVFLLIWKIKSISIFILCSIVGHFVKHFRIVVFLPYSVFSIYFYFTPCNQIKYAIFGRIHFPYQEITYCTTIVWFEYWFCGFCWIK